MRSVTRTGITAQAAVLTPGLPESKKSKKSKNCVGCGIAFLPTRWNQTRCRPNCRRNRDGDARSWIERNRARTAKRAGPSLFIGIDGEGVTDELTGEHYYCLLGCGDKHISCDGARLEFCEILSFLWAQFEEHPEASFVGFYLEYDWGQWLRTLPENRARYLFFPQGDPKHDIKPRLRRVNNHQRPWPVEYQGWQFDYLPSKRFSFRPKPPARLPDEKKKTFPWMHINNVGSFFQCSFLKAISPDNNPGLVTSEEYARIAKGKERRARAEFDREMIEYNTLECEILARLCSQLEEGLRATELKLARNQWHGPGQPAQKWMRKIGIPTGEKIREIVPEPVREAARKTYFGGWFEIFWHGPRPRGQVDFGYDINSAYPLIISQLPCLLHGRWVYAQPKGKQGQRLTWAEKDALPRDRLAFVRARLKGFHHMVGAMQHRLKDKRIVRPRETEGWFVLSELLAALDAGFVREIRLFEGWTFHKECDCPPPFAAIAELYEERIRVGKNTAQGRAQKLIYNSCAGKNMQSVGEPVFGNPIYATLITSGCRQMIIEAIRTHPDKANALVMVATDGVVFGSPHPGLPQDKNRLGAWTETQHKNLSLFMPGVYWDDADRERIARGEVPVFKSRGIPAKDFAKQIKAIDHAWNSWKGGQWPQITLPISFQVVSPKQALARGDWSLCGTVSTDKTRTISASPVPKRKADRPGRSLPFQAAPNPVSVPYDGTFGDEAREAQEDQWGDHPDGPIADLIYEVWHG